METCPGRFVLSLYHDDDEAHASYFGLGSALHETIEWGILENKDLDAMKFFVWERVEDFHEETMHSERRIIETSKRGMDTMQSDAERMIVNWFNHVHPDGNDRHPIYDKYEWPPKVEHSFQRTAESAGTQYPVWGSIDAVFTKPKWYQDDKQEHMIVDWKSGTQKQRSDFQLNFYRFGSGLDAVPAHFHHLDRVRKNAIVQEAAPYPGDPAMTMLIRNTEEVKLGILAGDIPDFTPSFLCPYCPVQEFCPVEGWPSKSRNRGDVCAPCG